MTASELWMLVCRVLAAAVGTAAFSLLFSVPGKYYWLCGIGGGAGWLVYSLFSLFGASAEEATFFAALTVVFLSRMFAVWERCPGTLFLIPGIFPLVPGAGVYWTSYYIVTDALSMALVTGFSALKAAVAIVLAIVFIFEIPQRFFAGVCRGIAGIFGEKDRKNCTENRKKNS